MPNVSPPNAGAAVADKRLGRSYRHDGLTRRDARWRIAVGLLDTIEQVAAERGVPESALAEDALALGLAKVLVDDALAEPAGDR